jgi:hypothetical protein
MSLEENKAIVRRIARADRSTAWLGFLTCSDIVRMLRVNL